jgi:hypothetical protein
VLVLAGLIEAVGQYYSKRAPLPADGLTTTALQLSAAAILALLAGSAVAELSEVRPDGFSTHSLLALAYLVGPGSLLAYSAFVWLLAHAPISTVSTYAYVNPGRRRPPRLGHPLRGDHRHDQRGLARHPSLGRLHTAQRRTPRRNKEVAERAREKADAGTRTPDPLLTMEVLYRLSYVGVCPASPAGVGGAGFEPA